MALYSSSLCLKGEINKNSKTEDTKYRFASSCFFKSGGFPSKTYLWKGQDDLEVHKKSAGDLCADKIN